MLTQAAILFDVISQERALAESPAQVERRRIAHVAEALRCCTGSSLAARLLGVVDRPAAACCAAG
jgi:hypothetical protein